MAIPFVPNSANIQAVVTNNAPVVQNQGAENDGREWTVLSCAGGTIDYIVSKIFITLAQTFSVVFDVLAEGRAPEVRNAHIAASNVHPPAPLDAAALDRYGHGIINGGASCYMNAGLQWIRKVQDGLLPAPRRAAPAQATSGNILLHEMRNLFRIMQGHGSRNVRADEINRFRNLCIRNGFARGHNRFEQHDANDFLTFIFTTLGIEPVWYIMEVKHDLGVPVSSIRNQEIQANILRLSCQNVPDASPLSHLLRPVTANYLYRLNNIQAQDRQRLPDEVRQIFHDNSNIELPLIARETIKFHEGHCPRIFPIIINKEQNLKIIPDATIDMPLIENPRRFARYSLQSAICHIGDAEGGGHFYTYSLERDNVGREHYILYDDSTVVLYDNPQVELEPGSTVSDDLAEHGYVYGYRFEGFVEHDPVT
jgi:hypothetical protein